MFSFRKKKRRLADRLLTKTVRQIIPESESYMELLEVEKKLDLVLMRKRLTLQESLKQPLKVSFTISAFVALKLAYAYASTLFFRSSVLCVLC